MLEIKDIKQDKHERVVRGIDQATGLDALIIVNNTNLGPATGGCRAMHYSSHEDQLYDNSNLAEGMTYKNALAGLNFGGGKATINTAAEDLTEDKLKSFADLLNEVNKDGLVYTTAGDIGTTSEHLYTLREHTQFVINPAGTDSGESTAFGVLMAMHGALQSIGQVFSDQIVAVSGYGKVGKRLTKFLRDEGAQVIVSDVVTPDIEYVPHSLGMGQVSTAHADGTVWSPCAVGNIVTPERVHMMHDNTIICGGANNQLYNNDIVNAAMAQKGITYVPDYLANSGGVIIVAARQEHNDYTLEYDSEPVMEKLRGIRQTTWDIMLESFRTGTPTEVLANAMAEERFNK